MKYFATWSLPILACLLIVPWARADEESAKETLGKKGMSINASGIVLREELDFRRSLDAIRKVAKELKTAEDNLARVRTANNRYEAEVGALRQQAVLVNAQLARLGSNQVRTHNRLVAQNNALVNRLKAMETKKPAFARKLQETSMAGNEVRERYVGQILKLREQATAIQRKYDALSKDEEVVAALEQLSLVTNKTYELSPSRGFQAGLRRLKSIEDTVLSEDVPLRRRGRSFLASVVLNGRHTHEMIVDSGASLISLPHQLAAESGIQPTAKDQNVKLTMADGRVVSGKLVKIDSVRVGQFQLEDVEAAILGPEATNAEPLLGMSFLGNFRFELDAQSGKLSIMKVETSPTSSRR